MKKIIISIVIILIVLVTVSYVNKNNKSAENKMADTEKTDTSMTKESSILGIIGEDGIPVAFHVVGNYKVDTEKSIVNWTGRKVILKNWIDTGTIKIKEGSMDFADSGLLSNSFVIDMTSIKALKTGAGQGEDKLSSHLKSADFFDVEKYPTSKFVAREFAVMKNTSTSTKEVIVNVKGDLTIKDITKEVVIPITHNFSNPEEITIKGSVDIDRTLWDIKYGSEKFFKSLGDKVIDDMFNISFDIKLKK